MSAQLNGACARLGVPIILASGTPCADGHASAAAGAPSPAAQASEQPPAQTLRTVDARAVPVASTETCRVLGCEARRKYGPYCWPHADAFLTRAYELTRDLGRGELS